MTTEASRSDSQLTSSYAVDGSTVTFRTPPQQNQAVFVEYLYGTHADDFSTLAYQQTSAGDGPVNHLLTDLEPGRVYQVTADGVLVDTPTASDQGGLRFTTTVAGKQSVVVS